MPRVRVCARAWVMITPRGCVWVCEHWLVFPCFSRQLKWHLFQEAFPSTLAKSVLRPPPSLSECLYLDESTCTTCGDAGAGPHETWQCQQAVRAGLLSEQRHLYLSAHQ